MHNEYTPNHTNSRCLRLIDSLWEEVERCMKKYIQL